MITICGFLFHTLHYFGEIIAGYLANDWISHLKELLTDQ